jgi:deoxyribodipyrimidine photo-lyase
LLTTGQVTPPVRIRRLNDRAIAMKGEFVLYWMTGFRRVQSNFALQRAVELSLQTGRPLLVFEALRAGYRWASDRLHQFVLEGMEVNRQRCTKAGVRYFSYVEPEPTAGKGLLEALAKTACAVITDDCPVFFLPRMLQAVAPRLAAAFEAVDSNGLFPLRSTERVFSSARQFRNHLQKTLPLHLNELPIDKPLELLKGQPPARLPRAIEQRWKSAPSLAALPIDHRVGPAPFRGGSAAAEQRLHHFVESVLPLWPDARNQPEVDGTSRLSPYLHFGQLAVHQVFSVLAQRERWTPQRLGKSNGGKREGWWKMSAPAEAFLDELVTWRELAFNFASHRPDDAQELATLPPWALATLRKHSGDPRPSSYSLRQLDAAQTHDPLWNAAMRQMQREGWMHGYLRMLWGKKILEWSKSPSAALHAMEQLMNRYSLDGRDPCSYSGFFWVLGRYDRPWGPERKIFGSVRYMSSENTARKMSVKRYLDTYRA